MFSKISLNDKNNLLKIMIFYSLLSYFICPVIGFSIKKTKEGITHGMLIGTIISIFLWFNFGITMIKIQ